MKSKTSLVVPATGKATVIRFPMGVLEKLGKAAAKSGRSRNSEIVYRLVESLNLDEEPRMMGTGS